MAFEDFRARLAMLMDQIAESPHDEHELQEKLREQIAEMQSMGLPIPDDLAGLERYLEEDLARPAARRRPPRGEPDGTEDV